MKKTAKLLALALALVLLVGLFSACSTRPSGVYTSTDGKTFEFHGKNFTFTVPSEKTTVMKGTYEIVEIDEDKRIYLTVTSTQVGDDKEQESNEILGGDNGLEFIMRKPGDKNPNTGEDLGIETAYIRVDKTTYYLVQ